jgi:hypothetical protein
VTSAFVSYAHEDQEFVLILVERLNEEEGLDIRYDQVVLHVGDSLIRAISREIAEGDFLIAVVSPSSVESEWCQTELALAKTQGINERRVKVLPVRLREVEMPAMLQDTFWADADRDDAATIALKLAASMRANLEGREADAERDAGAVEEREAESPRAEAADRAPLVAEIDEVADKVWDLLAQWELCKQGAPTVELTDKQRRLRWKFGLLPGDVQDTLPLIRNLSEAGWNDCFRVVAPRTAEPELQEELRAARTRLAEGLPLTSRWLIETSMGMADAGRRDAVSYLWRIRRGEDTKRIQVFISGTAMESANEYLPQEVAQAKETSGRSVVANLVGLDDPPEQVMVSTAGVSLTMPA